MMIAAMNIGGTNIRCNIIDKDGEIIATEFTDTKSNTLSHSIEMIVKKYDIKKVGISFAGQVNNGVILSAPNVNIDEPNIQKYFLKKHNIDLRIDNDLKCAALAEYEYFNCSSTMVAASIGTGFGAAIVENGKLITGLQNLAGEIGHVPYKFSQIACGCGNHYCIEAFCSGSALMRWVEYYDLPIKKHLLQELKELKDPKSEMILDNFHEGMLYAIGAIISLLNPELIVLGGGVVHKNRYLLDIVNDNIAKYALPTSLKQTKILISEIENAPLKGAEILARS
jgi:glucokinase